MELYSGNINKLIEELASLPGIGEKSAAGDPCHFDARWFDQFADVHRRGLSLQRRVRGDDHFLNITFQTHHQFFQPDVPRTDPKHR